MELLPFWAEIVLCYLCATKGMIFYSISIERFVPSINAIIYHGDKKQRDEIRMKHMPRTIGPKFPIVITSYEIAMSDARKFLRHYSWKYLVVDEVTTTDSLPFKLALFFFIIFYLQSFL